MLSSQVKKEVVLIDLSQHPICFKFVFSEIPDIITSIYLFAEVQVIAYREHYVAPVARTVHIAVVAVVGYVHPIFYPTIFAQYGIDLQTDIQVFPEILGASP